MERNPCITLLLVAIALVAAGCGNQNCQMTGLSVIPTSASADHPLATPNNQIQFSATSVVPKGCSSVACVNCSGQTWTVSDPVNISISNGPGNNGMATCVGPTNAPVTVTAMAHASKRSVIT